MKRTFADSTLPFVGRVVAWLYRMAFGGFEEASYRHNRKRFIQELEQDFSWLISEHSGRILTEEGIELPRAFDYVAVTIEFKEFRLCVTRGRGELYGRVASFSSPHDWEDLALIWNRISRSEPGNLPSRANDVLALALWIQDRYDNISEAIAAG